MPAKYRWVIVSAIFVAGLINYLDRAALSVAAPLVAVDLGLDPAQLGLVFSAFFVGYTLCCFPGGAAADRFGPKIVLLVTMIVWSVFCGLTAAVTSFSLLLVVRVLFGMAEGPYLSSSAKMIGAWFPRPQRATALGIVASGPLIGGALAGPVVGLLAVAFGWRISFVVVAALGIVWAAIWVRIGRDHAGHGPATALQDDGSHSSDAGSKPLHSFAFYVRQPTFVGVAIGYFSFSYLLYFFITWFPSYLTMEQHLSVQRMAIVSVGPWLFGAVGQIIGGIASDALVRKTGKGVFGRKLIASICLLGAGICIALMAQTHTVEEAVALMAVAVFLTQFSGSAYFGVILDTVEPARAGAVGGLMHTLANCSGIIAPAATGYVVQWTGQFAVAFILAAAVAAIGGLSCAVLVRQPNVAGQSARRAPAAV